MLSECNWFLFTLFQCTLICIESPSERTLHQIQLQSIWENITPFKYFLWESGVKMDLYRNLWLDTIWNYEKSSISSQQISNLFLMQLNKYPAVQIQILSNSCIWTDSRKRQHFQYQNKCSFVVVCYVVYTKLLVHILIYHGISSL